MPNEILGTGSVISTAELLRWDQNPMTESEMFEAHGRALAKLKAAKARIAVISNTLGDYGAWLEWTGVLMRQFANNPGGADCPADRLHQCMSLSEACQQMNELAGRFSEAEFLQKQIDNF